MILKVYINFTEYWYALSAHCRNHKLGYSFWSQFLENSNLSLTSYTGPPNYRSSTIFICEYCHFNKRWKTKNTLAENDTREGNHIFDQDKCTTSIYKYILQNIRRFSTVCGLSSCCYALWKKKFERRLQFCCRGNLTWAFWNGLAFTKAFVVFFFWEKCGAIHSKVITSYKFFYLLV